MSNGSKKEEVAHGTLRFQKAQKKCMLCLTVGNRYVMQTRMVFAIKIILGFFMVIGISIALYGAWEIIETVNFVKASPGRAKAKFVGYNQEIVETRSVSPSPTWPGQQDFHDSSSIMSYPQFEYRTKDGQIRQVQESKIHVVEHFKAGQEVEIILSPYPYRDPRLAGFYSLYVRDLSILAVGLCFIFVPLLMWKVVIPSLESTAGIQLAAIVEKLFGTIPSIRIGPFSIRFLLKGFAGIVILVLLISLIASLAPFVEQLHLGTGWGLIEALEKKHFDDAREMIAKRKGIHKTNEYDQSPLLLALEARQPKLARMLIEAGADVNIKSKMMMTPLRVATQSGDIDMVKLLISRGASPDAPEDEFPPVAYALIKGYDDIARVLVEGGTNLHKRYSFGGGMRTVGDMAVHARKQELVEFIRQRGGTFTQ